MGEDSLHSILYLKKEKRILNMVQHKTICSDPFILLIDIITESYINLSLITIVSNFAPWLTTVQ